MRVISTEPHQSVVKRTICGNCGADLEYTPSDVREDKMTDYTGCTDIYKVIDCGNCSNQITVGF